MAPFVPARDLRSKYSLAFEELLVATSVPAPAARLVPSDPTPATPTGRARGPIPELPPVVPVPSVAPAHRILLGTVRGTSEARVQFSSGPAAGTEFQIRAEADRVSLSVLTEGAMSRQTQGQVLSEFTRRINRQKGRILSASARRDEAQNRDRNEDQG